jgi:N-acyl-D-aspartate/D-glutamate deacylase
MAAELRAALAAGAFGLSTSRTLLHRGADGQLVPGTFAGRDELTELRVRLLLLRGQLGETLPLGLELRLELLRRLLGLLLALALLLHRL